MDKKTLSSFELCSPFMTYMPIFIHIGPKLAKLVFWGGSRGDGVGWLGGLGGSNQKITMDLRFSVHSLLPHQVSSKLDQIGKVSTLGWVRGWGRGVGVVGSKKKICPPVTFLF